MYFLTSNDPDYTIKGSRDPLGFQVLWQATGRKIIPHLSTVSVSIIDFQIMCIASYVRHERKMNDETFRVFFNRLEKLMGYARLKKNSSEGFNGIDRLRKLLSSSSSSVYCSDSVEILSNQRAYGIWGKYNRPFTDSGIVQTAGFYELMKAKLKAVPKFENIVARLIKPGPSESIKFKKDELDGLFPLIATPLGDERALFVKALLCDNCDDALLTIMDAHPSLKNHTDFFSLIDAATETSKNDQLRFYLSQIKRTEKILCPISRIFRHLQTRSYWKKYELELFELPQIIPAEDASDLETTVQKLNSILAMPKLSQIEGVISRNEETAQKRKSAAWMINRENGLEVNHFEGAMPIDGYLPDVACDNYYFIPSFLNIHRQLT
jgi:hypothetical protein